MTGKIELRGDQIKIVMLNSRKKEPAPLRLKRRKIFRSIS
jgi:hypothetical protein